MASNIRTILIIMGTIACVIIVFAHPENMHTDKTNSNITHNNDNCPIILTELNILENAHGIYRVGPMASNDRYLYVYDRDAFVVAILDTMLRRVGEFGLFGQGPGELSGSISQLIDIHNGIALIDRGNGKIIIYDEDHNFIYERRLNNIVFNSNPATYGSWPL